MNGVGHVTAKSGVFVPIRGPGGKVVTRERAAPCVSSEWTVR